jgi:hypothetical protein
MIWYSPELDEIILIELCKFEWNYPMQLTVRNNIFSWDDIDEEKFHSVSWICLGDL